MGQEWTSYTFNYPIVINTQQDRYIVKEHRQKTFVTLSGFWPLMRWGDGGGGLSESVKKENSRRKSFLGIIQNEFLKICEKWYLLMWKLIKATRNKRSGGSILQIFVRHTFRTWNTSPNNVKISKKYPLLTLTNYFDTTFTVHTFIKSSVSF